MKQQSFLVTIPFNNDGTNQTSTKDISDLLTNKGFHGATVIDCNDFAEVELRSFERNPTDPKYLQETITRLINQGGDWSRFTSTSSVLFTDGK